MHCVKCRKPTETKDMKVAKTKNNSTAQSGTCAVCNTRKYKCVKSFCGGDVVSMVALITSGITFPGQRYPGDMHLLTYNFLGPNTR